MKKRTQERTYITPNFSVFLCEGKDNNGINCNLIKLEHVMKQNFLTHLHSDI